MKLVIVESPAKAATINKYLGSDFNVLATYGHVRDLPARDGSVDPEKDFSMLWETRGQKPLRAIFDKAEDAEEIILATDPDREGEAISWHVEQLLRAKKSLAHKSLSRISFNAVTRSAVKEALEARRSIDSALVDAYLSRRALDYLVGFTLSPILWRKLPGARSAGRVQSVALRLICEREKEIAAFNTREYWSIEAMLAPEEGPLFKARLVEVAGEKLEKFSLQNEAAATSAASHVQGKRYHVAEVKEKRQRQNPYAPFITSTLQQEAAGKLGFGAARTMRTAQKLYEGIDVGGERTGLITYMRTDGIDMAPEAIQAIRTHISGQFGESYIPKAPRRYKSAKKHAQEAHECIRPTDISLLPGKINAMLDADAAKLYALIWKRAVASQMAAAVFDNTSLRLVADDGQSVLSAHGRVLAFDGFLRLYGQSGSAPADTQQKLPPMQTGARASAQTVEKKQHFTQPPPRFGEASLVKRLEELGIGRPSTYASIISVLQDRHYVRLEKKRFVPEDKGMLVTAFLESFFHHYVQYDFTAELEENLDSIARGQIDRLSFLRGFWQAFLQTAEGMKDMRIGEVLDALNEGLASIVFAPDPEQPEKDPRSCPKCKTGTLSLKVSRYGAFVGCSAYPECAYTRSFAGSQDSGGEERELGKHPQTGAMILLKSGRFGPYVEMAIDDSLKRMGLPDKTTPAEMNLERAIALLSLPRTIGLHPEDKKPITASLGRYGPYIKHGSAYGKLGDSEEIFSIGIDRAVSILAEKKKPRGKAPLRELGEHPQLKAPLLVMDGRYGPYVKCGSVNATLPKTTTPEDIDLATAVALVDAKKAAKKKPAKRKVTRKRSKKA